MWEHTVQHLLNHCNVARSYHLRIRVASTATTVSFSSQPRFSGNWLVDTWKCFNQSSWFSKYLNKLGSSIENLHFSIKVFFFCFVFIFEHQFARHAGTARDQEIKQFTGSLNPPVSFVELIVQREFVVYVARKAQLQSKLGWYFGAFDSLWKDTVMRRRALTHNWNSSYSTCKLCTMSIFMMHNVSSCS